MWFNTLRCVMRYTSLSACLLALSFSSVLGQSAPSDPTLPPTTTTIRIWISEKEVASVHGGFPSADLLNELNKKCVGVVLTDNQAKADYRLEAGRAWCCTPSGESRGYNFTLFSKDGDAIYSTKTHTLKNAAKDLCNAISRTRTK